MVCLSKLKLRGLTCASRPIDEHKESSTLLRAVHLVRLIAMRSTRVGVCTGATRAACTWRAEARRRAGGADAELACRDYVPTQMYLFVSWMYSHWPGQHSPCTTDARCGQPDGTGRFEEP